MAKDYETYEGRRVYVAATSYQLAQEVSGAWAGRESPYVVKIPDGAAAVKSGAFYFDSDIVTVLIPDSVKLIGENAFDY